MLPGVTMRWTQLWVANYVLFHRVYVRNATTIRRESILGRIAHDGVLLAVVPTAIFNRVSQGCPLRNPIVRHRGTSRYLARLLWFAALLLYAASPVQGNRGRHFLCRLLVVLLGVTLYWKQVCVPN